MRKPASLISTVASAAVLMGTVMIAPTATAAEASAATIEEGKKIAFDRKKGNCLACHMIAGGNLPGNIGPPLIAMKARFPDRAKLRAQIADPTKANPNSIMPPFGRHDALTSAELDKVVDFIHTL